MNMENKPSVEGILKKHFDKLVASDPDKNWYSWDDKEFKESRKIIYDAMQEYASLLVAQRDKQLKETLLLYQNMCDQITKDQKEIEGLKEILKGRSEELDFMIQQHDRCFIKQKEAEKQRDHYKALAEAAHEIINLPLGIKGKVDIDEDMGKEVKSALKKYNELKNEQRIVEGL